MSRVPTPHEAHAYFLGYDTGVASRPTDEEIQAWGREIVGRAWREGYAAGLDVEVSAAHARMLAEMAAVGLARERSETYVRRTP